MMFFNEGMILFQLIFAIPSHLFMRYIGPTGHLSLSLIAWGTLTIGMAFAKKARELLAIQALLVSELSLYEYCDTMHSSFKGMTQAAFFPGMIIYFSLWYRKRDQTMRIALLFGGAIIASGLGSVFVCNYSFYLMGNTL